MKVGRAYYERLARQKLASTMGVIHTYCANAPPGDLAGALFKLTLIETMTKEALAEYNEHMAKANAAP